METDHQKTSHEISIALIQKDVEYIKQNIAGINAQLQMMDKNYARHDDVTAVIKLVEELKKTLNGKVDVSEFTPIKSTLYKINWLLITAVIGAVLAIVLKV